MDATRKALTRKILTRKVLTRKLLTIKVPTGKVLLLENTTTTRYISPYLT